MGFHRHDADGEGEIANQTTDHGKLLRIFPAEDRHGRLGQVEELHDHSRDSSKVAGSAASAPAGREGFFGDVGRMVGCVEIARSKKKIDTRVLARLPIRLARPWIGSKVFPRSELQRVDVDADDHRRPLPLCSFDEGEVPRMEGPHGRNQRGGSSLFSQTESNRTHLFRILNKPHRYPLLRRHFFLEPIPSWPQKQSAFPDLMGSSFFASIGIFVLLALLDAASAKSSGGEPLRRALLMTILWLLFSLGYGGYIWHSRGLSPALDFATIYGLEYVLSVDNLFAFYGTFRLFEIRGASQSQLLTLGVILAVLLRGLLIWAGLSLLGKYDALFPLFGILLFLAAARLSRKRESEPAVLAGRKLAFFSPEGLRETSHWLFRREGRFPVPSARLLALLSIELADLLFALDSIPAAFAITLDPTVVFPANLCAVMGLRSLYPLVQHAADRLQWLNRAIPWALALMGGELCLKPWLSIPTAFTIAMIASLFLIACLLAAKRKRSRSQ